MLQLRESQFQPKNTPTIFIALVSPHAPAFGVLGLWKQEETIKSGSLALGRN